MDDRYLDLLAEECAEVIQAICKIKRFGMDDKYPDGRTGKDALLDEIGDVKAIIAHMNIHGEDFFRLRSSLKNKTEKLKVYGPDGSYLKDKLHVQGETK